MELGISAAGGQEMMRKRLTEYTTIWNANCDAKNPRPIPELKRDLESWERTLGSRAPQPNALAAHIKDKEFDGQAWGVEHKNSFNDLITQARQKLKIKAPREEEDATTSMMTPPVASQNAQGLSLSDDVAKQKGMLSEIQRDGPNNDNSSTPTFQSSSEASKVIYSNPRSSRTNFPESTGGLEEYDFDAPPSSQYEPGLPIMQVQEGKDEGVNTEPNPRGSSQQ